MNIIHCQITLIAKIPIAKCPIAKVPIAKCPIAKIPIAKCPIAKCPVAKIHSSRSNELTKGQNVSLTQMNEIEVYSARNLFLPGNMKK